jgi:GT2 family glycosyltransferase
LVTDKWLSKIINGFKDPKIGIICPVSNSANQLSVHYNKKYSPAVWAKYVEGACDNKIIDTVTPVGFCMAITSNCIKAVMGREKRTIPFNPLYGKGYGEECDFGEVARILGYRQVCMTNTFIYHKHSATFSRIKDIHLIKKRSSQIYHNKWGHIFKSKQKVWNHTKPLEYLNNLLKKI